ncbi:DUF3014 domain-containing protein [Pseudoxanthomonas suwonensis]|uniref:DUF3014 domain-containing protein n=1 Tax=Pseudoxanthomonas suwonensis TaxID=314722 RepID=A0A0E3UPM5_9GAMM|nr:DUF3014 domain-containing protein [Pseudoxanthomonas suwonensis]AKC88171.1 hypothetical protein WQ53_04265 [Pseudoxanthomonas suwonensis]
MRSIASRWPWLLVVVAVVAAGWWLLRPRTNVPETGAGPTAAAPALERPASPADPDATAIRHPLDPQDMADPALPTLDDSDPAAWAALAELAGDASVLDVLLRDHLIQRLVTMIDNLTERRINQRALAMRALPGEFSVEADAIEDDAADGASLRIAQANARRYEPYVRAFVQADPERLAAAYRRFYPLFQQAYAELGRPDAYFNDRLVEVIDHLLQAPEPAEPPRVVPGAHGKFRFADPALETLSVGQKALVRLAPEQRTQVKQQLRAIRRALARG